MSSIRSFGPKTFDSSESTCSPGGAHGVIGLFVAVACAATLHRDGRSVADAVDAAVALQPIAGSAASTLFGVGLIGAAFLAASILPLSTAYSVCEYAGTESAVDDRFGEAKLFT